MVTAYTFALQLLVAGIAAAQMAADWPAGDLFVICHGNDGPTGDGDGTGKAPLAQLTCALCTLISAPCAILPTADIVSTVNARSLADVCLWNDARIIAFGSPTGQYQRGPPAFAPISG
jgi:hypothetical protein